MSQQTLSVVSWETMSGSGHAPPLLLLIGAAASALGALLVLMLFWHVLRRILDRPRVPLASGTYIFLGFLCAILSVTGIAALAVVRALDDWAPIRQGSAVAEIDCRKTDQGRLRISFTPLLPNGYPAGVHESANLDDAECRVAGEILRFRAPLDRLGLGQLHRIVRLGQRPRAGLTPSWRALPRPLGLPLASARSDQVSLPPADRMLYRLFVKPDGYWWEKRPD